MSNNLNLKADKLYAVAKFAAKLNVAQNTFFEELNDFIDTLPDEVQDYIINSMIATDEISHQLSLIAVLHSPGRLKKVSEGLDIEVARKELDIMIKDGLGNKDHFKYIKPGNKVTL